MTVIPAAASARAAAAMVAAAAPADGSRTAIRTCRASRSRPAASWPRKPAWSSAAASSAGCGSAGAFSRTAGGHGGQVDPLRADEDLGGGAQRVQPPAERRRQGVLLGRGAQREVHRGRRRDRHVAVAAEADGAVRGDRGGGQPQRGGQRPGPGGQPRIRPRRRRVDAAGRGDQPAGLAGVAQRGESEPVQAQPVPPAQRQHHRRERGRGGSDGEHRGRDQVPGGGPGQPQPGGRGGEDGGLPGGQLAEDLVVAVDVGGDAHRPVPAAGSWSLIAGASVTVRGCREPGGRAGRCGRQRPGCRRVPRAGGAGGRRRGRTGPGRRGAARPRRTRTGPPS